MNLLVRIVVVAIVVIVFLLVSLYLLSGSNLLERIECPSCNCDCSAELQQAKGLHGVEENKMEEGEDALEALEEMRALMRPVSLHTIIEEDIERADAMELRIEEVDNESEGLPDIEPQVKVGTSADKPVAEEKSIQVMVGASAGDSETVPST